MAVSPLKLIKDFFDTAARPMDLAAMKNEWTKGGLTDEDKAQIIAGLTDGSLTY